MHRARGLQGGYSGTQESVVARPHFSLLQLAPLVAGPELASAMIKDTVKYLGIQPTGVSGLRGPYLQVRPVRPAIHCSSLGYRD